MLLAETPDKLKQNIRNEKTEENLHQVLKNFFIFLRQKGKKSPVLGNIFW